MKRSRRRQKAVSKTLAAAIALIVIIVVVSTVWYFGTLSPATSESPAPTQTPAATPTNTPTQTNTPQPTQPTNATGIENFAVGKTASYDIKQFNSTGLEFELTVDYNITEGTYGDDAVWILEEIMMSKIDNETREIWIFWTVRKTDLAPLHFASVEFVDNVFSGSFESASVIGLETAVLRIDPSTYVGVEDVAVTAGTFTNCHKAISTIDTEVTATWVNEEIPLWGLVKQQITTTEGDLIALIELTAYE